jgi:hypothetical protein
MSYLDRLAEFVVATHFAELPAATVAAAKDRDARHAPRDGDCGRAPRGFIS